MNGDDTLKLFMKSDIGRLRQINQDTVCGKTASNSFAWIIICDGMGGTSGGDVAGKMVAEKISEIFENELSKKSIPKDLKDLMLFAAEKANSIVFEESKKNENYKNMGTTLVLAVVLERYLHILYVGDSRLYIVNKEKITQITEDHSIVWNMVKNGEITKEEAKIHPQKNIITKAVGICESLNADYKTQKIEQGDLILLCTDGLTNQIDDNEILEIFKHNKIEHVSEKLIESANNNGGNDNITVGILEIDS